MCPKSVLLTIALLWWLTCILEVSPVGLYEYHEEFCYARKACWFSSSFWSGLCQTGYQQSPINLIPTIPTHIHHDWALLPEYVAEPYYLQNNGHTLKILFEESPHHHQAQKFILKGFGLHDSYTFSQLHFHWGPHDQKGSEHRLNYTSFAMEMHLLHYSSRYRSLEKAAAAHWDPSALAVLGVFLQSDPSAPTNDALKSIISNMQTEYRKSPNTIKVNEKLDLKQLLPISTTPFFFYQGSLTTPKCTEIVAWIVFKNPVLISPQDVNSFRQINEGIGPLLRNYRPVQSLNQRKFVYYDSSAEDLVVNAMEKVVNKF